MKNLIYQVSIGPPSRLYEFCQASIKLYAERVGADYILQTDPILKIAPDSRRSGRSREATAKHGGFLPIFEKENALDLLGAYDRVAIIDSDIWAREDAPNLFSELGVADFAGVRERDMPSIPKHAKKLVNFSRLMFRPFRDVDWDWKGNVADFQNMGLMLMGNSFQDYLNGESAREFLARPEFRDFIDGVGHLKWSTDQTLLNWWIRKTRMARRNLDWKWNALYGAVQPERLKEAYFLHFFLRDHLPEKGENVERLIRSI